MFDSANDTVRDSRDAIIGQTVKETRYSSQVRDCRQCGFTFVDYDDADADLCDECAGRNGGGSR